MNLLLALAFSSSFAYASECDLKPFALPFSVSGTELVFDKTKFELKTGNAYENVTKARVPYDHIGERLRAVTLVPKDSSQSRYSIFLYTNRNGKLVGLNSKADDQDMKAFKFAGDNSGCVVENYTLHRANANTLYSRTACGKFKAMGNSHGNAQEQAKKFSTEFAKILSAEKNPLAYMENGAIKTVSSANIADAIKYMEGCGRYSGIIQESRPVLPKGVPAAAPVTPKSPADTGA